MAFAADDPARKEFLGHPVGLYILFFTEIWERFSYYGMRAILIFYLTNYLRMTDQAAGGIYGDYTGLVYLTPLLGGFLSDRYIGLQRATMWGGVLMAIGQFLLAWHAWPTAGGGAAAAQHLGIFWIGLILLILGNGLFKPNISTIVGKLYETGDVRRDGGFTIFYMGINVGALSPFIVSTLGERIGWHLGFLSAGIGMLLGVVTFQFGRGLLGDRGRTPDGANAAASADHGPDLTTGQKTVLGVAALPGILAAVYFSYAAYAATHGVIDAIRATMWPVIFSICVCMYVFLKMRCTRAEMKKVNVIFVLALFVLFFWAAFEQAGSSLNLFAERYTRLSLLGYSFPAGWFQNVNPIFIILLAPIFSWLWVKLSGMGKEPSTPAKMAFGVFFNAFAYVVMIFAMMGAASGARVGPGWLTTLYFLQTCGELCLSPVGLSMVTKLAPVRYGAMLMGVWFLANAWANKLAGVGAGYLEPLGPELLFKIVAATLAAVGLILVLCVPWLRKQMGEIH
jgi:proton-dependent oligopeptide transporter, POT family